MNNKKSPLCSRQGDRVQDKYTTLVLNNKIRTRILKLFLSGGKYSVVELTRLLNIPDPRSHIRYLRIAGYPISDYWVNTKFSRYKVYFLKTVSSK